MQPGDASATFPIYWLCLCLTTAAACTFLITPESPILCTLIKASQTGSDKPAGTGTLSNRLSQHFSLLRCNEGESMHSIHRRRASTDSAAGLSNDAIMSKLLLQTPGVLNTKYQAVGRHASRFTCLKSAASCVATAESMSSQPSPGRRLHIPRGLSSQANTLSPKPPPIAAAAACRTCMACAFCRRLRPTGMGFR